MARSKHLPVPPRTDTDALVEAWGTRIDAPLLQLALVHRSYANEAGGIANNERLEFLGDSVLSIIIAQKLYEQYPDVAESDLSRMRAATVSQQPLASLGNAQFTASALTTTDQMKQDAVQKVPEGVSVASDLSILTQLIPGRTVYWIGHTGEPAPDYVVIDRRSNSWGGNPPTNAAQYAADRYGHSYAKYATVGTIDIVRRVD